MNAIDALLTEPHDDLAALLKPLDRGFTVRKSSAHHVQVLQDGAIFADWWPGKGTTMSDGVRGPKCKTAEAVVAWLLAM